MFGRGGDWSDVENFIGINPLGILVVVGFLFWALWSVKKEDASTAKSLLILFIGLPLIGLLLNFTFDILGGIFRFIFSKDGVGTILGIGVFYLILRLIGNHLLDERDKSDKN